MEKDYYEILGVSPKAGDREIKKAYLKLARRLHPDINPGDPQASALYKKVLEAYRVLADRLSRERYDRTGRPGPGPGGELPGSERTGASDTRGLENIIRDVFHDEVELDTAAGKVRGEDVHQVLEITFQESLRGARKELVYQRDAPCGACQGKGVARGARIIPCSECEGSGLVRVQRGPYTVRKICRRCEGAGEIGSQACSACGGRGRGLVTERREIVVGAGCDSGSRIVVSGGGQPGKGGAESGDLVVNLKVMPHPHLERRGYNLYGSVPVTLTEAALGATILVPTAERKASLKIPPGTQCGQQFRLRGRGVRMAGGSKRGDLYVTMRVLIPEVRDVDARRLFRELEKIYPENPRVEK